MTDTKHTPGPWLYNDRTRWVSSVKSTPQWEIVCYEVSEDDGNLIAAAPDLLNLCELVNDSFGGGRVITFSDSDIEDFVAAIAKAKGETK